MKFYMNMQLILSEEWEFHTGREAINIVSIAIDAPQDTISALTGKIGKLPGISVKTAYSSVVTRHEE